MTSLGQTLDLFAADLPDLAGRYRRAWSQWRGESVEVGRLQRDSSIEVYESMWASLTAWAVGNELPIDRLTAGDLDLYLASRGGHEDLSDRYSWRLLRLVDRVLRCDARANHAEPNLAAEQALARRPELRFANAVDRDPLPAALAAYEAKRLVVFLSAVRPGRGSTADNWQDVRNRASAAVMLGAGVTPGETRALEVPDVVVACGRGRGVPWKLRVAGDGNGPSRETPIAPWAGQLLQYWLAVRFQQGIPGQMLFPSTRSSGKAWGKVSHYESTKEVLRAAGVEDIEGGSFRLRHTFALRQLRRGKSPVDVARWLGVTDPAVMARYQRVVLTPIGVI